MMDWTDRHCRVFHRQITRRTRLYTEMVTTGALRHGDVARHLRFSAQEHPLALQVGGSEVEDLAHAARLAAAWGYDEINLNCGCPSERVQRGAFGACLMAEPDLVADGLKAMQDAGPLPVSVKHRIGLGREESYAWVRDFVGTVAQRSGCRIFIVHARNAWLEGLSPRQNREIPPLRWEIVHRLKRDFPALTVVINGGLRDDDTLAQQLQHVDGVMIGRQAYHEPWAMAGWDRRFFGQAGPAALREDVEDAMVRYMEQEALDGTPWPHVARHLLGLYNGLPGARLWRQVWSDHRLKGLPAREVSRRARQAMAQAASHEPPRSCTTAAAG